MSDGLLPTALANSGCAAPAVDPRANHEPARELIRSTTGRAEV
jgi:hypothetical protein